MAQFTCSTCGVEFYQKSHLLRHIEASHPIWVDSAADIEKVLGELDYPKTRDDLVKYPSRKVFLIRKEFLSLKKFLPSLTYRDPVEVVKALGKLKSRKTKELRS